jgi:hypothetical protein
MYNTRTVPESASPVRAYVELPVSGAVSRLDDEVVIGRDPQDSLASDQFLRIPEHTVSRRHARIRLSGGTYFIEDLHSYNGTFVLGKRLALGAVTNRETLIEKIMNLVYELFPLAERALILLSRKPGEAPTPMAARRRDGSVEDPQALRLSRTIVHEVLNKKLDGSDYPMGLKAGQISVQTRILTICDIYDVLTAGERPCKKALPQEAALDLLDDECRAGRLDARLFEVFVGAKAWGTVQ